MSFNTELGHDYINFYQLADKDSMEFLQWMYEKKKLENAILVFYSDHGPRYSEIQNTNKHALILDLHFQKRNKGNNVPVYLRQSNFAFLE
jgi:arylsulfatase A-like enzyme